jgi:protoporphyrinogen oxidase
MNPQRGPVPDIAGRGAERMSPNGMEVVVIGAGPAGLTAAYELCKRGVRPTVLEQDRVVGGISRTVEADGWRFDIGGHRFFTKVGAVERLWHEMLDDDEFLTRPRMSRIFYRGSFFDYPLKPMNALRGLGLREAALCVLSYAWARVRPPKDQSTFEGWTSARFGTRLYRIFFKTYTEKVWGVPATEIQADWAAQRIKNLSLLKAVTNAVMPRRGPAVTSLIEEFQYPKQGPGMMWERAQEIVEKQGAQVLFDVPVNHIRWVKGAAVSVGARLGGLEVHYPADHVISSMPLGALVEAMDPPPPPDVLAAARALGHRDFLSVALVVPKEQAFPDNWIYVHSPEVRLGRVQNFGAWSPFMVKDGLTCLGLEYFVFEGDDLWRMADDDLVELGRTELATLGLVDSSEVLAGYVVRMPKAYPMYDDAYKTNVDVLRSWLGENVPNVHPVGRNGMHRYNNQDHSMYTAMLTVENLFGAAHDIWAVNVDADYHEEKGAGDDASPSTGRDAPVVPARRGQPAASGAEPSLAAGSGRREGS